jgi:hypothetical protein
MGLLPSPYEVLMSNIDAHDAIREFRCSRTTDCGLMFRLSLFRHPGSVTVSSRTPSRRTMLEEADDPSAATGTSLAPSRSMTPRAPRPNKGRWLLLALMVVAFVTSESGVSAAQTAGTNPPPTPSVGQGTPLTQGTALLPLASVMPRRFTILKAAPPWVDDAPHPLPPVPQALRLWGFSQDVTTQYGVRASIRARDPDAI